MSHSMLQILRGECSFFKKIKKSPLFLVRQTFKCRQQGFLPLDSPPPPCAIITLRRFYQILKKESFMKKVVIGIVVVAGVFMLILFNSNSNSGDDAVSKLIKCKKFEITEEQEIFGQKVSTTRTVKGWKNGKCVYQFVANTPKIKGMPGGGATKRVTSCNLTKAQLKEIEANSKVISELPKEYQLASATKKYIYDGKTCEEYWAK